MSACRECEIDRRIADLTEALEIANRSADEQMRYKREAEAECAKLREVLREWIETVQLVDPGVYSCMEEKTKDALSGCTNLVGACIIAFENPLENCHECGGMGYDQGQNSGGEDGIIQCQSCVGTGVVWSGASTKKFNND